MNHLREDKKFYKNKISKNIKKAKFESKEHTKNLKELRLVTYNCAKIISKRFKFNPIAIIAKLTWRKDFQELKQG